MPMFPRLHLREKRKSLNRHRPNRLCRNRKWKGCEVGENHSPFNRSRLQRTRTVVEDAGEAEVVGGGGAVVERGLLQLQHKLQPPLLQKRMPLKQLVPHRHREQLGHRLLLVRVRREL
jgi:hypothetical protein